MLRSSGVPVSLDALDSFGERIAARWPVERWIDQLALEGDPLADTLETDEAASLTGDNFPIANFQDAVSNTESLDNASAAFNPRRAEYLIVWQAWVRDTNYDIYGRRLAADGAPIGVTFLICAAPRGQVAPTVAYDSVGDQYWVSWTDFREGSTADVYLRRVSPTGTLVGSEIVPNDGPNDAFGARIAAGSGRCVVAWINDPHDGNAHTLVRGYNSSGSPVTTALLLSEPVGIAEATDVGFDSEDNSFLVVWDELHSGFADVWAYRLTSDLAGMGRFAVCSNAGSHQQKPRVAYGAGADAFLVVWEDGRSMQTWDIYGQLISRAGTLAGGAIAVFPGQFHDQLPVVAGHESLPEFLVTYLRDISGASQHQIFASRVSSGGAVGSSFPVRLWYNIRIRPTIAPRSGSPDYLVAWTDNGVATQTDIQAQSVRSDATLVGSLVVVSRGRKGQEVPAVAHAAPRSEVLAAWADYRSGSDYDLYARRVAVGAGVTGAEVVVGNTADLYGEPTVAYDQRSDEYLVAWQEVHSGSTGYEIYGRRVGGGGDPRGAAFLISAGTATENEGRPHLATNTAAGEHLVVWHAFTNGNWRIWAQRVTPAGQLLGGNVVVSASTSDTQNPRAVYNAARNEYVVVWQDFRNARWDVYAQRLGATGGPLGGNLAIATATGNKGRCDVASDPTTGAYLVVWDDTRAGNDDVYAQRLDGNGSLSGSNFAVAATTAAEVAPVTGFDPASKRFLVAWWEYRGTNDYDVYAQFLPGSGATDQASFAVSTAAETQSQVDVVKNAPGGPLLVLWQDFRAGSYDVYGQWVSAGSGRLIRRVIRHR